MSERDRLAERFEGHRAHLLGVAYRMLGSRSEAEDAVQEAWFRLSRADPSTVDNLGGWLTTVVAFLAATRGGDIEALLGLLDPGVVRRADRVALRAGMAPELRGARAVAEETAGNARPARFAEPALVDGRVGLVLAPRGRLRLALSLTVRDGRITDIDVVADPARLRQLDVAVLDI